MNLDLDSVEAEFTMSSSFGWKLHRIFPKKLTGLPEIRELQKSIIVYKYCTTTNQQSSVSSDIYGSFGYETQNLQKKTEI